MLRNLVIIIALALVYLLIKRLLNNKKTNQSQSNAPQSEDTVQCLVCNTFIPKNEALINQEYYFCCEQHLNDWQSRH